MSNKDKQTSKKNPGPEKRKLPKDELSPEQLDNVSGGKYDPTDRSSGRDKKAKAEEG